ncbi:serpin B3 [Mus musculus]|uniref:Serine (Or cysteine) peptidase inhibitor, clade B (Ovalbumin), member 3D n=1 Tax=Mus musculus TaxID=10090 RepID=Q6UKZ0_MOUSE|nr:serpin B3 [Mus musculus]AAI38291.1 Serine (or cysteine) peptidase inhibitor, clade B (ovalbumin), member 3D [Mus musculus]AAI38292.1 Serine (or cysteine) peptidase inhibitor, clade B (ovalbumin), member 3D [Mus musculus]AAR89290.1 serpinb3d [Mus musculus]EDL39852.1 mCG8992 [Mus musculus]|eukprot:NP_958764.1 serpin B3 [Mus musculus]
MDLFAVATTKFTLELYRQLRESDNNIFYSPISMMRTLAMLLLGAKANTEQQIKKVLHFNETTKKTTEKSAESHDEENVHQQFQMLMTQLNKFNNAYDLKVPNSIYGAKDFPFLQTFLKDIRKYYQANVESLDFAHAAEESQKKINSWMARQTNGKIKDLFPSGSLNSSTILVLVNAVYFKGQWNHKFDEKHTREEKFWLNKNTSKPVQMMKQRNKFNFIFLENVQAKIVEIPYKGKELSMFVLLPVEIDGLKKFEEQLTADKLLQWTRAENMHMTELYLSLPQFKVEEKYDLRVPLEHMGMVDAFDPQKADFSGMSNSQGLVVSKVLHKSFVEVNEEGAEAATAMSVESRSLSVPKPNDFSCNHPFLFVMKQNKTNSILFFGRVSSP